MVRAIRVLLLCVVGLVSSVGGSQGARPEPVGIIAWSDDGHVVLTNTAGTTVRRMPAPDEAEFGLSPDGTHLAISGEGLRIMEVATGNTRTLISSGELPERLGAPAFSPGGTLVAAAYADGSCLRQRSRAGVAVAAADGSAVTKRPVWPRASPWTTGQFTRFVDVSEVTDSGDLTFEESRYTYGECRYQELRREIYWQLPARASGPRQVVADYELGMAARSPDGLRLAYTLGDGDACTFWVMDRSRRTLIAHLEYVTYGCWFRAGITFAWSPDSRMLYYADGRRITARDLATGRDRVLFRPQGAPQSCGPIGPPCASHRVLGVSRGGDWLALAQATGRTPAKQTLYVVSTATGRARRVPPPSKRATPFAVSLG